MSRLRASELEAILEFVAEADSECGEDPFPPHVLERLLRLVPCDLPVTYGEQDWTAQRVLHYTEFPQRNASATDEALGEATFWSVARHNPMMRYRASTLDSRAIKLSDFLSTRALHRSVLYDRWLRPGGVEHEIEVQVSANLSQEQAFVFRRGPGRDFSERDRTVLDLLRPHLARLHELNTLRKRLRQLAAPAPADGEADLTPREREVLDLVATGKTNVEVAAVLFIAPTTVRKHLENVYEKLGVRTRTAAVARFRGR